MDELIPDPARPALVQPNEEFAGFWRRFNAYGIDATIVWLIAMLVGYLVLGSAFAQDVPVDQLQQINDLLAAAQSGQVSPALMDQVKNALISSMFGGSILGADTNVMIVVSAFYNIFFVTSVLQATPGKHWLKCRVVNVDGSRLTLLQSATRHVLTGISAVALFIPCVTIFFTKERLAPHDMLCGSRVIHTKHR